jgi:hypothetical protein
MNQAHLHLALNHLPIIGTLLGLITLLAGVILKDPGIRKAGLGLFIISGIMVIPAFLTGEGAERVLKYIGQEVETIGQKHEDLGEIVVWICGGTGLLALVALFIEKKYASYFKILIYSILVISLVNCFLLKKLGTTGGEIRHTEIRSASEGGVPAGLQMPEEEEEDD